MEPKTLNVLMRPGPVISGFPSSSLEPGLGARGRARTVITKDGSHQDQQAAQDLGNKPGPGYPPGREGKPRL